MIQLAQLYQKGDGVEKNITKAIRLYQMEIELKIHLECFNSLKHM
jgi:TPR repeat protein